MSSTNGVAESPVDINWPPCIPPQGGSDPIRTEPPEEDRPIWFFWDLFAWWRNRRERKLLQEIRKLKLELAYATEEKDRCAEALDNLRAWTQASTANAERLIAALGGSPPPDKRRGSVMP